MDSNSFRDEEVYGDDNTTPGDGVRFDTICSLELSNGS